MDFEAWRCRHDETLFCPEEGCTKREGCARERGWKTSDLVSSLIRQRDAARADYLALVDEATATQVAHAKIKTRRARR